VNLTSACISQEAIFSNDLNYARVYGIPAEQLIAHLKQVFHIARGLLITIKIQGVTERRGKLRVRIPHTKTMKCAGVSMCPEHVLLRKI
jgi:hypothetical protein